MTTDTSDDELTQPSAHDGPAPAERSYHVPTGHPDPRNPYYQEYVDAKGIVAAQQWDARLWISRPGLWR